MTKDLENMTDLEQAIENARGIMSPEEVISGKIAGGDLYVSQSSSERRR